MRGQGLHGLDLPIDRVHARELPYVVVQAHPISQVVVHEFLSLKAVHRLVRAFEPERRLDGVPERRVVHLILQHRRCVLRRDLFLRSPLVDCRDSLNRWRTVEDERRDDRRRRTQVLLDLLGPSLAIFRRCPRMPRHYRPAWLAQLVGCCYCSNFGRRFRSSLLRIGPHRYHREWRCRRHGLDSSRRLSGLYRLSQPAGR